MTLSQHLVREEGGINTTSNGVMRVLTKMPAFQDCRSKCLNKFIFFRLHCYLFFLFYFFFRCFYPCCFPSTFNLFLFFILRVFSTFLFSCWFVFLTLEDVECGVFLAVSLFHFNNSNLGSGSTPHHKATGSSPSLNRAPIKITYLIKNYLPAT